MNNNPICERLCDKFPSFYKDFTVNFLTIINSSLEDQYNTHRLSNTLETYSAYIKRFFPYIKNVTKPEKDDYKLLRKTISKNFYDHLSYWYNDYGSKLPNIFTDTRMKKGMKDLPYYFLNTNDQPKPTFSIIENFLNDSIQMVDDPIIDTPNQDTNCITIQKGDATFRVHKVRTIEFEGIVLTF